MRRVIENTFIYGIIYFKISALLPLVYIIGNNINGLFILLFFSPFMFSLVCFYIQYFIILFYFQQLAY